MINEGVKSGTNIANLYVKILPLALTMNTVNGFVTEKLDKVKIPWVLYSSSCKKLVLTSSSAVLSEESNKILSTDVYTR